MSAIASSRAFRLNIEEAISFIWRDRDWLVKIALGSLFSLLSLILVGAVLVQGYLLVLAERVARGEPSPLPEWDNWGELTRKGLIGLLVSFVYALPAVLLWCLVYGLMFAVQLGLAGLSTGGTGGSDEAAGAAALLGLLVMMFGYGLLILVSLAVGAVLPAAMAQLVLHDADPAAAFRFREVADFMGRYRGQYAIALLLGYGAIYLASSLGYLACCIGIFVTTFVSYIFLTHMIGQLCWHERQMRAAQGEW